ncbi:MAG: hypothetical protein ACLFVP_07320 [Candidatus Bathyarchaeia archaeon]
MFSSDEYDTSFYVVSKQNNPMIKRITDLSGGEMRVDPGLGVDTHLDLLERHLDDIDLTICPHEKTIMAGLRDHIVDEGLEVPMTFPTSTFALERSKILQRKLFPAEYNPRWRAFQPSRYSVRTDLIEDVKVWVDELGGACNAVFKPDSPTAGKGVAVGGEHFGSFSELKELYISTMGEPFIIEERFDGVESSCQIWYNGSIGHMKGHRYPETRDYKRAFEGDKGPNTGGMGCYMDNKSRLPYMIEGDWEAGARLAEKTVKNTEEWAEQNGIDTSGMHPCMYYLAMAHPGKVFEGNIGRPGDPEDILPLYTMKNDLIDLYFNLIEGSPTRLEFEKKAIVLVYVVPPTYGGKMQYSDEITLNFERVLNPEQGVPAFYPGDVESRGVDKIYFKSSRSIAVTAKADSLEEASEMAHAGAEKIESLAKPKGLIWHRRDIATRPHIEGSIRRRKALKST